MTLIENFKPAALALCITIAAAVSCNPAQAEENQTLTVAGGCFWCVESDFETIPGVIDAVSGYTGGTTKNPDYKSVSRGGTGHYEAVQIRFDPDVVSRGELLALFLRSIDVTDASGQFCDRGDSYRTAIFVSNPQEKAIATQIKADAQSALGQTIVTPILPASPFFPAEASHQDYYKGKNLVITRFGPIRQSKAYKKYRKACGRDKRVRELWGSAAPFAGS